MRKRVGSPEVYADTDCDWDANSLTCRQNGHVQPALRAIAIREMRRRGLPKPRARRVLGSSLSSFLDEMEIREEAE